MQPPSSNVLCTLLIHCRHDVYSSMDDSVLPDRQRKTPPLGARPMSVRVQQRLQWRVLE